MMDECMDEWIDGWMIQVCLLNIHSKNGRNVYDEPVVKNPSDDLISVLMVARRDKSQGCF